MWKVYIVLLILSAACAVVLSAPAPEYKPRYEKPTPEPLPSLEDAKKVMTARKRAQAKVEVRDGRARLVVDGKLTPPCFYVTSSRGLKPGGVSQIGDFRDAGVRIYLTFLSLGRREDWNRGVGVWLGHNQYDMGGGWFNDEGVMKGIAQCRNAFARDLPIAGSPQADVAVFVNETSFYHMRWWMAAVYRYNGLLTQLRVLNEAGVPYHVYLQSDVTRKDLPEYRVYLLLNAHHVTPQEKAAIQALRRDRKVLAFVHAPGVVGAQDPATAIESLTGIKVKALLPQDVPLSVVPVTGDHPLLQDLDGRLSGLSLSGPAFEVIDSSATPIGAYPDSGETAVAAKEFGAWRSVFFGGVGMSARFFHNLAKWGGSLVCRGTRRCGLRQPALRHDPRTLEGQEDADVSDPLPCHRPHDRAHSRRPNADPDA